MCFKDIENDRSDSFISLGKSSLLQITIGQTTGKTDESLTRLTCPEAR